MLWKARGLQAKTRIEELAKKKARSEADRCQFLLEVAFSENAFGKSRGNVSKSPDTILEHLVFMSMDKKSRVYLRFAYAKDRKDPIAFFALEVLKASFAMIDDVPSVEIDGCSFIITKDPLQIKAIPHKE